MQATIHKKGHNAFQHNTHNIDIPDEIGARVQKYLAAANAINGAALRIQRDTLYPDLPQAKAQVIIYQDRSNTEIQLEYVNARKVAGDNFLEAARILSNFSPTASVSVEFGRTTYDYYLYAACRYEDAAKMAAEVSDKTTASSLYASAALAWKGGIMHKISAGYPQGAETICEDSNLRNIIKMADSTDVYDAYSEVYESIAMSHIAHCIAQNKTVPTENIYSSCNFNEKVINLYYKAAEMAQKAGDKERFDTMGLRINEINCMHFAYWENRVSLLRSQNTQE